MHADKGFTLIEALVAMAVLALGAVSLLSATESHTARISDVTDRVAARWAGEYHLAELRLGVGSAGDTTPLTQYGRRFTVQTIRAETSDPDLQRVTLRVARAETDVVLAVLDGYLDAGALP
ncbi:type II secretion system protein GspI [Sulfitobacter alexandrii]|uniref:Type II secretion system protein I n=2 Tax=Sulfitobacter alexandrii TaxID=1917485 RepID=A0A1J0WLU0_9RHOB|nr:type II secretion system protein GspI [Sulfitobacter alexandrii]